MFSQRTLRIPLIWKNTGLAVSLLAITGCSVYQPQPVEIMSEMAPTTGWDSGGVEGNVANDWIATFEDEHLTLLVDEALAANPNLEASAYILSIAISQARQANAALFPNVNAGAEASQSRRFGITEEQERLGLTQNTTVLGVSLGLNWEADVWGRLSSAERGAALSAQASAADYAFARQSLAGQVARAWFQCQVALEQLRLAEEFVINFEQSYELSQARFRAGEVTAQDTSTARANLANALQNAQQAGVAYRAAVRSLEILLGRYPSDEIKVPSRLDRMPAPVPAGLPSQLLERRPDLIAAERRVSAAFQLAKSASVARLPQFSITGSIGTRSESFSDLFSASNTLANIGANLFQPLFDAGLRKAQFEQAEGEQMLAVANYRNTALLAFQEVENTLDLEDSLRRQQESLTVAADSFEEAREIAFVRYRQGETDLTSFLEVQRQSLQAQSTLILIKGQRLSNRVDLHLALGGNFGDGAINSLPAPPLLPSQSKNAAHNDT